MNAIAVLLFALLVKFLFVGLRVFFIVWLIYMNANPTRKTVRNRMISDVLEMAFCLDLLWSGLWLGVITVYEVTLNYNELPFAFEVWKLSALALDLIAVSYFIVIVLFFDLKVCCGFVS